jgi:hypothetical protein
MIAELVARHPEQHVPADPEALTRFCTFTDFARFVTQRAGTGHAAGDAMAHPAGTLHMLPGQFYYSILK